MSSRALVVSRYEKDISWTNDFTNVYLYNKGERLGLDNEIMLPNIGRESHTFIYHIATNYSKLEDITIFLQDNPFDHSPNILAQIQYIYTSEVLSEFGWLSVWLLDSGALQYKDFCLGGSTYLYDENYFKIFGEDESKQWQFGAGAQYYVSRKQIHKRPLEFYTKMLNMFDDPDSGHEYPWQVERFWGLIYSL